MIRPRVHGRNPARQWSSIHYLLSVPLVSTAITEGGKGDVKIEILNFSNWLPTIGLSSSCCRDNNHVQGQSTAAVLHPTKSISETTREGRIKRSVLLYVVNATPNEPTQRKRWGSRFHHPSPAHSVDRAVRERQAAEPLIRFLTTGAKLN